MILAKPLLLVMLAVTSWHVIGSQQPVRHHLSSGQQRLLERIALYDKMESEFIGRTASSSEQYARFDSLRRISSKEDMLAFARHPSPVVRAYVFSTLLKQKDARNSFAMLQTDARDTAVFRHQVGCIGGASTMRLFMLVNFCAAAKRGQILPTAAQRRRAEHLYQQLPDHDVEEKIIARQFKDDE